MPLSPSPSCRRGFTLIELLVVIAIIAILVGVAFPVYSKVIEKARRTDAASFMSQVKTALVAYEQEYSDWPPALLTNAPPAATNQPANDARIVGSTNAQPSHSTKWEDLFKTLTASGDDTFLKANNKRRIVFLEVPVKMLDNQAEPTNAKTFLDPWGREFNIAVDSNGDNKLGELPNTKATGTNATTNYTINSSIGIWSYGKEPTNVTQYIVTWR